MICGSIFDSPRLKRELADIEEKISDPTVWADATRSQPFMRERKRLETLLADDAELGRRSDDIEAYFDLAREGEDTEPDLTREIPLLVDYADKLESKTMLSGETDMLNAIVTVHPGAGGTESQDWAEMLMRMYIRWGERQHFKVEINEIQDGDEAGIKSATFTITGEFAFGLLSGETGVHRLVRISPFDSAKRDTPASPASSSARRSMTPSSLTSRPKTSGSIPIVPAAKAVSTSIRPIQPSALRTFRRVS